MGKYEKLHARILRGESDANIDFMELCRLFRRMGFNERSRGSHHIFRKTGIVEMINLQREEGKAKIYQVRQVRRIFLKYNLKNQKN